MLKGKKPAKVISLLIESSVSVLHYLEYTKAKLPLKITDVITGVLKAKRKLKNLTGFSLVSLRL